MGRRPKDLVREARREFFRTEAAMTERSASDPVARHSGRDGLERTILAALAAAGIGDAPTLEQLAAVDQRFLPSEENETLLSNGLLRQRIRPSGFPFRRLPRGLRAV
jgi:hypothetical protein